MVRAKLLNVLLVVLMLTVSFGAVQAQDQNIVEIAVGNEDFSTLVTAVEAAGLVDVLADPEAEWTVFAPTNAAFEALPEGVLDMLLADTELLTRVLTYHVVEGAVTSDMLSDMAAPSMEMTAPGADLMGSELEITVGDDGTVMVNDATVITADIIASNGVIHVIDSVLVPPEIAEMLADGMMMDDMMEYALYATENPGELENDMVVGLANDLSEASSMFGGFTDIGSLQSIKFAANGDAYITYDVDAEIGGILVVDGLAAADSMDVGMASRFITGTETGLVAPKGLEVIDNLGLVVVANFGAANIKGFALDADGDMTPMFVINDFGDAGGSVWDVHYDAESDTLFASGTTGTLLVYSNFSSEMGATLTSSVIPANEMGEQISVNLHGVDYDAASDTVILTDVGSADDATDGQIFTITGVMDAEGLTPVTSQIGGPETMLGNPVDVAFDGANIYVAEKSNDVVLRYDNILDMMGMADQAADMSLEVTKAESVALYAGM